jgi:acyl carrier protein
MAGEVEKLFSTVLRLPVDGMNDAVSPDNTPRWDSVSAIDLALAIEDTFNVRLTTRDITSMRTIGLVKKVLRAKGVANV